MQHGDTIAERYRLDRKIGQGGTGSIWLAQDERLDRQVAIKFLFASNPQHQLRLAKRVALEAKIAASIQHRNVVQIFDFGAHDGNIPFIVMEALSGRSMGEAFENSHSFSLDMLIHIMSEVLRGLSTVHDAGIVHRDLKPENIFLVSERGGKLSPKLLDFGISRSLEPDTRRSAVTTTEGLILGTPQYMSPEQARGLGNVDKRTDIYSVGIILFEALSGFVPFDSENMGDLLLKVIRGKAPPMSQVVPQIGAPLCDVIDKALARTREQRYSDAAEMHDALVAAAAHVPVSFDRSAHLFPPASLKDRESSRISGSEFPLNDSGSAPEMGEEELEESGGERQTRRARRRSDDSEKRRSDEGGRKPRQESDPGATVRKRTPQSADLTIERSGGSSQKAAQRWLPWAAFGVAMLSVVGAVAFALVTRGNSADQSGFIVVSAGAPRDTSSAPAAAVAGTAAQTPKPREAEPAPAPAASAEPRVRRATSNRPRTQRKVEDPMQARAADVASAFSRQKDKVTDCLDEHPEDMEGAPQLTVRLRVEPSGRVADAALLPEAISSKSVGVCVSRAVGSMTFGPQEQTTVFRIPLIWRRK